MIRSRRGTAIASTTDGTCSACHMRLQPMLFQDLTRGNDFGQCPSCKPASSTIARPPRRTALLERPELGGLNEGLSNLRSTVPG